MIIILPLFWVISAVCEYTAFVGPQECPVLIRILFGFIGLIAFLGPAIA